MSGGADALRGHVYQHTYLAYRALASAAATKLTTLGLKHIVKSFRIEGRNAEQGKVWDLVLRRDDGTTESLECKDTTISKADREVFYKRVRDEVLSGTPAHSMQIGWVTDPTKQDNILEHFAGMSSVEGRLFETIPTLPPRSVTTPESAVLEALFYLCHEYENGTDPKAIGISVTDAASLIRNLVVRRCRANDLEFAVQILSESIFDRGSGNAALELIRGSLASAVVNDRQVDLTIKQFIQQVGTLSVALLTEGHFKTILDNFSAASPHEREHERVIWDRLPGKPEKVWPLKERVPGYSASASRAVIAQQGIGKSVLSQQAFKESAYRGDKHRTILLDVELIEDELAMHLLPFCTMLSGLGPCWIGIDGLDLISQSSRKSWQRTIDRLLGLPNLVLLVTAREEVLEAGEWLQRLTAGLQRINLRRLERQEIEREFKRVGLPVPGNASLIEVLRNPFLLSLYARIVTVEDLPLESSGEVTAFRIVEEVWNRRVRSPSEGHRAVGQPDLSSTLKRIAVRHMIAGTLHGERVISRPDNSDADQGTSMLIHEGILQRQGTHAVRWIHDWLAEYAIIDYLLGGLEHVNSTSLAAAIVGQSSNLPDHVMRLVAIAGAKWVVSHRHEYGSTAAYFAALYATCRGPSHHALAMLMEGPAKHLELAQLPMGLLIEAVHYAVSLRARQWTEQILHLPDTLYLGESGPQLLQIVSQFDLEVADSE